jgi:hypothetical protein
LFILWRLFITAVLIYLRKEDKNEILCLTQLHGNGWGHNREHFSPIKKIKKYVEVVPRAFYFFSVANPRPLFFITTI